VGQRPRQPAADTQTLIPARFSPAALLLAALAAFPLSASALDVDRLSPEDENTLHNVLGALEPIVAAAKEDGSANLMTWDELYAPLNVDQRALLDEFRTLTGESLGATSQFFGEAETPPELVPVGPQTYYVSGEGEKTLPPQYLPKPVFDAYERMMAAMEEALGRRLLVESGYRSPAYQLYLFLHYLPTHGFSIRETNRHVALPGHSEHGAPQRQAIDFINEDGINGEEVPEEFEALPEYVWLQRHARSHGFHLSYPRGNPDNTAFEPWHWHYEPRSEPPSEPEPPPAP
jgi:hypothetical protein